MVKKVTNADIAKSKAKVIAEKKRYADLMRRISVQRKHVGKGRVKKLR